MPNIETLIDSVSQTITNYKTESSDKISQLILHPDTSKHCNFNIVSGNMTGTYPFSTVIRGLTDIPAEFRKSMDYYLVGLRKIFCFFDDILIVSNVSEEDHIKLVTDCLWKLDADSLCINLLKRHFAKQEILWLVYIKNSIRYFPTQIYNICYSCTQTT